MVPHLTTALTGPLLDLERRFLANDTRIEQWLRAHWQEHTPPFYCSVDLRNAGFKLAPVDTNLFPGGWNNLTNEMLPLAVQAAMAAIEKICPEAKNLLLIPGPCTGAPEHAQNLQRLIRVFNQAGLNVRLGALPQHGATPGPLALPEGGSLMLEPLVRTRGRLGLKDFDPCTILLNNDLSGGVPPELAGLHEQYLLPPLHASWGVRRRTIHFRSYEEVAKKFAKLLGMDPWLIHPLVAGTGPVDLAQMGVLEAVQSQIDAVLVKVRRKYKEYGINEKPYVVVRSDASAGLGELLVVRDPKDLEQAGERLRDGLAGQGRGGLPELLIQEGVPSHERVNQAVAEPVVTMIDRYVIGGFYRLQPEPGREGSGGIVPLAFAEAQQLPRPGEKPGASAPNRFYMYGVLARLAMLAASYELEATDPNAEIDE